MKYLAIDLETTGLDHQRDQVIELAAVLEDTAAPEIPVEDLLSFRVLFKHDRTEGNWFAIEMNRDLLIEAQKFGHDPQEAWFLFREWMHDQGVRKPEKTTLAGKNVGSFDYQFLPVRVQQYFLHRMLDPGSVFVDWSKDKLPNLAELTGTQVKHTALEDARDVVRVLRRSSDPRWAER